jgi:hypothetical protein
MMMLRRVYLVHTERNRASVASCGVGRLLIQHHVSGRSLKTQP